ncbi:MAG: ABC transporter permease [Microcoleus sp. PH2017_29_MFU_D_A]|jgi:spermidine/putrescine transport system permease protein|uniref:ABC transporter permease n=1 Tax=unclassified Microcoleus TaxID=2642155 RepID=UPI001E0B71F1|nr:MULTISPECIES: ABC transporter permease [unclassified Microcoleus]MCC3419004.1 ABC transporter permease [Microcoleus sp. PH2017_07_MST_O_A]MCC3431565.1 ABC transporter permease [Microcoleus sp. PH2017_04_SCI_O_A]MCC3442146.1 ABC transporter permease [Microcoleus sp. PH2017_03_ELD_O_A]MCC3506922.1 ABC transporter permease [Microcoleus sp. PH2017_19_SFW_U_A]MCC3510378.1 ABC transporter permease [Microcoleus sp. PH2017_17_BER_D_A]TAE07965.1 MAG: ABC transporter permease [Oscillatoriales cyanob
MKSLFPNPKSNSEHRKLYNLLLLLFPASAWLSVFFVLPVLIVLLYSFLERGTYGGITWVFTLSNYQRLFSWVFLGVIGRSLFLAFLTTAACLLVGYPLAFFIATRPPRWRNALLLLIIIPFWTNFLVRTYAWIILLRSEGVVNIALQNLQIITEPLNLLFTPFAVAIGLIYGYLPFMVLPLYSSIERFNFSLVEAAQDLGANDIRTFWRVFLPLTTRGIVAGSILVFVPAVGAFITPDILGGSKTIMVGNLIQNQFMKSRDWPFGSALSMLLTVIILVPVLIYFRVSDETE